MVYKCLHGLAPSYLADVCTPVSSIVGRWQLRSANGETLVVPGTSPVQSLQNAAARLITGARCRDYIMPVLCQLHWLPVR